MDSSNSQAEFCVTTLTERERGDQNVPNLAARNLNKWVEIFKKLGFNFDAHFTDDTAACMIVGEARHEGRALRPTVFRIVRQR